MYMYIHIRIYIHAIVADSNFLPHRFFSSDQTRATAARRVCRNLDERAADALVLADFNF